MAERGAPGHERRRHRRHELSASAEIQLRGQPRLLKVCNISLCGALLATDEQTLCELSRDELHEITLFDPATNSEPITVPARIIRRIGNAIAVEWNGDKHSTWRIAEMLARMLSAPPI